MPLDDPIPDATRGAPLRQLARTVTPTGRARPFTRDELIVSKTDAKGVITYANDVFLRVAEISEHEALSAPHSLIRHPDMPRCMFKLLWDRIAAKQKIFAYVLNLSRSGDHYWVFAHVTPSLDGRGGWNDSR
jgi:PAS domain-containing protein